MTTRIEQIVARNIRFNRVYPAVQAAFEQFQDYEIQRDKPNVLIRKRATGSRTYTVNISEGDHFLVGKCDGPSYERREESPCKHVYIVCIRMLNAWLNNRQLDEFSYQMRNTITDGYEALCEAPGINYTKLNIADTRFSGIDDHKIRPAEEAEDDWEPVTVADQQEKFKEELKEMQEKAIDEVQDIVLDDTIKTKEKWDKASEERKEVFAAGVTGKTQAVVPVSKAPPVKITKAFGGTIGDIPPNLVMTLHSKAYVTVKGLIYAATKMDLKSIETQHIEKSWKNKDKRSVFKAKVTFKDGRFFEAHGIAIPDGENVKNKLMYPFIDHFAETRAIGRALRNAMAFGDPTIEELPEYEAQDE